MGMVLILGWAQEARVVRNCWSPDRSSVLMWSTPASASSVQIASRAAPGWSGVAQKWTRQPLRVDPVAGLAADKVL